MHAMGPKLRRRDLLGLSVLGIASWATGCKRSPKGMSGLDPAPRAASLNAAEIRVARDAGLLRSNLANVGPLGAPDGNGLRLPAGFTSRIVARTGQEPVPGKSSYKWHLAPDGGATFATVDGGHIYVSNSEVGGSGGGVGALRFDASGELSDAYAILSGSTTNCAGGRTPWGTWLSCEEVPQGLVHECDPTGKTPAVARPALGRFRHEAAAVDLAERRVYLSEDERDGRFYRFTAKGTLASGALDLSSGLLEVAELTGGSVSWHEVSDPGFSRGTPTRKQVAKSTPFDGGEGLWFHEGRVYLSTKGDERVWEYDARTLRMRVLYDPKTAKNPVLRAVDNLTGSGGGDVLVAEDGDDLQLVAILPNGELRPLAQIVGHPGSEVTGPAFSPSGNRLYFSSQRGKDGNGVTFEVSGPFHVEG